MLSLSTIRRNSCILKSDRFVLKLHESVHKHHSAIFVKMAADMVQRLVIKMFDQPIEIIFHLQIHNNVSIFFEVNGLHLKNFLPQQFQFPQ